MVWCVIAFDGIVLQIVREHYLRDDIWCGSDICTICAHQNEDLVLEKNPQPKNKKFPFPHYILLDTCVVLNQVSHIFHEGLYFRPRIIIF
jgi:exosome complex exonuclease DIS3/RRP44